MGFKIPEKINTRVHAVIHFSVVTPQIHHERETKLKTKFKLMTMALASEKRNLTTKIALVEDSTVFSVCVADSCVNAGSSV